MSLTFTEIFCNQIIQLCTMLIHVSYPSVCVPTVFLDHSEQLVPLHHVCFTLRGRVQSRHQSYIYLFFVPYSLCEVFPNKATLANELLFSYSLFPLMLQFEFNNNSTFNHKVAADCRSFFLSPCKPLIVFSEVRKEILYKDYTEVQF